MSEKLTLILLVVASAFLAGLGVYVARYGSIPLGLGLVMITPVAQFLCVFASVVLHELGHYACARLLGLHVVGVEIGTGDILLWQGKLLGTQRQIREKLTQGIVRVWQWHRHRLRARLLLLYSAGLLVNCALAGFCALAIWGPPYSLADEVSSRALIPLFATLLCWNAFLIATNAWPSRGANGLETDGLLILNLLRDGAKTVPGSISWAALADEGGGEAHLDAIAAYLTLPDMPREIRNDHLDGFITGALMLGASPRMNEALRYAEELARECPGELTVKGSYGSVLIELGEFEKGESLLREVYEKDPVPFDRGIAAAYLGLAHLRRGNAAESDFWFERSREADPEGLLLRRLRGASPSCSREQ